MVYQDIYLNLPQYIYTAFSFPFDATEFQKSWRFKEFYQRYEFRG